MEISKFIIKSVIDANQVLLFNTLTTALVNLNNEKYNEIFINHDFSDQSIVQQLASMGYIVDSHEAELAILDKIRKTDLDNRVQVVTIFTTTDCNARCYYCFEDGIKQFDMTLETADKTIAFIKKFYPDKLLTIMWFGGEPLLNFEIIKYITLRLKEHGYELRTHVTSNGSLINQEILDFFIGHYSIVSFQITIDDIGENYYRIKRYRDFTADDAFDTVINNVKLLFKNDIITSIRVNYVSEKIDKAKETLLKIKELLSDYNPSKFYIYLSPLTFKGNCGMTCDLEKGKEHPMVQLMKFQQEIGFPLNSRIQKDKERILLGAYGLIPSGNSCGMSTKRRIVINADGNLYKCHRFAGIEKYACGNVDDGVDEQSENYKFFRNERIDSTDCKNCSILPICQGGCRARKTFYGDSQKCTAIKKVRSELLKLYYNDYIKENKIQSLTKK